MGALFADVKDEIYDETTCHLVGVQAARPTGPQRRDSRLGVSRLKDEAELVG